MLIEESVLGWKEYELEVIRDANDNFIVVCSIENIDPMGVHTGDSITVAPAMTLTDREYQRLRDAARAVMTEIGVETGGSNVQFAVDPEDGRVLVIEMNPRVSRSSALASKATGYPIAKIAAKLAVGYTLDELKNDITGTSAAFEPTIDYVVVKWPRFAFEKFPGADATLGTQMKSVGEAMSIGRTFCEALQKAARSLETGKDGLVSLFDRVDYRVARGAEAAARSRRWSAPELEPPKTLPPPTRRRDAARALAKLVAIPTRGSPLLRRATRCALGVTRRRALRAHGDRSVVPRAAPAHRRRRSSASRAASSRTTRCATYKRLGFSAIAQIAQLAAARRRRRARAAQARTASPPSTRASTRAPPSSSRTRRTSIRPTRPRARARADRRKRKVIILGGGPNRIGQGIEFDYCCVHAVHGAARARASRP